MSNYLCLQRSLPGGDQQAAFTGPNAGNVCQIRRMAGEIQGQSKDMGGKLGEGKFVGPEQAHDGPFVEVKDLVGGYMIIEAKSLAEAQTVARECPGLVGPGSGVEIIEIHRP